MRDATMSLGTLLLLAFSVACNPSNNTATVAVAPGVFDATEAQQDIRTGKLKFEIRGLTNEVQDTSYGKSFEHSAVAIPVGESKYSKADFMLFCSVKRLSGGDPERPRKDDAFAVVFIHNGLGKFSESGGSKTHSEQWEPEKIEVRPEVVFVGTPVEGTAAQE
jgi:hypothetical protein